MKKFFHSVSILCYDNDGGSGEGGGEGGEGGSADTGLAGQAGAGNANANANNAGGGDSGKTFTQEELNKILAEDKRKHQEKIKTLEASYQELLENQNLTKEERDKLQARLEDVQKAQLTKEQRAELERKKMEESYNNRLEEALKSASHWENLYKESTVDRSLQDAAMSADAFNPQQIIGLLKPMTTLKEEDGKLVPMIDFPDVSEKDGKPINTLRTPEDAVKRMRELPKMWGNLFKSNVVSGVGAGNANNAGNTDFDYENMTPEQYRKHRREIQERLSKR